MLTIHILPKAGFVRIKSRIVGRKCKIMRKKSLPKREKFPPKLYYWGKSVKKWQKIPQKICSTQWNSCMMCSIEKYYFYANHLKKIRFFEKLQKYVATPPRVHFSKYFQTTTLLSTFIVKNGRKDSIFTKK